MAWFKKAQVPKDQKAVKIPEGMWVKCDTCKEIVYRKELERNLTTEPGVLGAIDHAHSPGTDLLLNLVVGY